MLIGHLDVRGSASAFRATNPATGLAFGPEFGSGTIADAELACELAASAFDLYRATSLAERATFLETIAQNILDLGPSLIECAMQESGLPQARLEGERMRTVNQLRLFAKLVRDGRWLSATLDSALPERVPARPDLRMRKIALGPVAVFGASNFPLAFSVAGGDTASALAAGCPVVVKAHGAHPGTSELVGRAVRAALQTCQLPEGVFSLLQGDGRTVGRAVVTHPAIKAVGFTGSRQGGLALVQMAAQRPEPIPVYAEMSSINPMFLLPAALAQAAAAIATGFVDSLMMGAGQFCTNPGLVLALDGADLDLFCSTAATALQGKAAATMLTPGIHAAFGHGVEKLSKAAGVSLLARGQAGDAACAGQAALFVTDAATFLAHPQLEEEVFGASSLIIRCQTLQQFNEIAEYIDGQLTATLFLREEDRDAALALLPVLERKVGRILINAYPTGVEVSYAMVHGGPFPATSDSRSTSVGAEAIERFLRPVCYQDFPAFLLPAALDDDNSLGLWRLRDGELTQA
ncbi:aldehyde dehydrogenase (NADP(+)) [Undibacterium sp. CCC2.1]|nr:MULTISPECIES: aldehyde dehydrogenase (NADP(+)) [unclassified Undibacterium]MEB0137661.1 aldehyde dehydrogenase (NADP(+)) [Undibacterium sp. CCC2.1]MEB0172687.1 aldehyde dehydrogenase (NADP(+)) [Undibacterium sp. CCC1.1]MEB0177389.1 aldehyde dehydrogenase (NADP(+)) [Undibacterium sp. CCC3.4]MEB0215482.1 aldehyde dehydrogenase (NADP(+)) [Undibacterium sp. 5I2]WPX45657.1 aldehyde dehydrogenase (NADP(+)) [Undibacterium sp. CCC3.4]